MQTDKKLNEQTLLKEFISNQKVNRKITCVESYETPDFILEEGRKTISVEVTRLYHEETKQREALYERLVNAAHQIFQDTYDDDLYVLITFSDIPMDVRKRDEPIYVKKIFQIVEKVFLSNRKYDFNVSTKSFEVENSYVDSIDISNSRGFAHWQPFGAFIVEFADFQWIKERIILKEKRLDEYHKKYDENWLLLAANFGHESSTYTFYDPLKHKIESKFDKIYLYLQVDKEVIELK